MTHLEVEAGGKKSLHKIEIVGKRGFIKARIEMVGIEGEARAPMADVPVADSR